MSVSLDDKYTVTLTATGIAKLQNCADVMTDKAPTAAVRICALPNMRDGQLTTGTTFGATGVRRLEKRKSDRERFTA